MSSGEIKMLREQNAAFRVDSAEVTALLDRAIGSTGAKNAIRLELLVDGIALARAECARLRTDLDDARAMLSAAREAMLAERVARELADIELMAARVYISYTSRATHHDTEQDALWRIWRDARAARESKP